MPLNGGVLKTFEKAPETRKTHRTMNRAPHIRSVDLEMTQERKGTIEAERAGVDSEQEACGQQRGQAGPSGRAFAGEGATLVPELGA